MPVRLKLASRLGLLVAVVSLVAGFANAPSTSAGDAPASSPSAAELHVAPDQAGSVGLAKVVGPPMAKTPPVLAAFAPVKGTLHPRVRLAYENAAEVAKTRWRGCGLRWTILAAFGAVESAHGTHNDGATVLEDSGRVEPPIIGLPLDGRGGRARILDTDDGVLDGNTVYDHAVGPFQFIPDTWTRHGVDANGDGVADPHSVDDAALAAASYLCTAARGNMRDNEALHRAIYSYNHSEAYVETVRAQLDRFDRAFGFRPNPPYVRPGEEQAEPVPVAPPATPAPITVAPATTAPPTTSPPATTAPTTTPPTSTTTTTPPTTSSPSTTDASGPSTTPAP